MIDSNSLIDAVYEAVDEINLMRPADKQVPKSLEAALSGPEAVLDSLSLVNLVVAIEEKFEDVFGVLINLADQKAFSVEHNPFRTMGTLIEYAGSLMQQEPGT